MTELTIFDSQVRIIEAVRSLVANDSNLDEVIIIINAEIARSYQLGHKDGIAAITEIHNKYKT